MNYIPSWSHSGAPAEYTSCSFFNVFVHEARKYAEEHPDYSNSVSQFNVDHEFATITGDEFDELEELDFVEMNDNNKTQEFEQDPYSEENELSNLFNEEEDPQVLDKIAMMPTKSTRLQ